MFDLQLYHQQIRTKIKTFFKIIFFAIHSRNLCKKMLEFQQAFLNSLQNQFCTKRICKSLHVTLLARFNVILI